MNYDRRFIEGVKPKQVATAFPLLRFVVLVSFFVFVLGVLFR